MILTLHKDSQGNFVPAEKEKITVALAAKDDIPKKHNCPKGDQDFWESTLQELERSKNVTLEELGL